MARGVAWAVSAIALVIGAIGMLNTMVMSVAERIREIGTLRAIGWTKRRVMRVIFFESVLLSVGGELLGTLAAIGLTKYLSNFRLTSGYIKGEIAPVVLLQGLLVAVLVGVGGAAYPAFWGASQPPVESLHASRQRETSQSHLIARHQVRGSDREIGGHRHENNRRRGRSSLVAIDLDPVTSQDGGHEFANSPWAIKTVFVSEGIGFLVKHGDSPGVLLRLYG